MSDLVERLRAAARKACERHNRIDQFTPTWERKPKDFIEWEAADALEAKDAEIERLQGHTKSLYLGTEMLREKIAAQKAEIERLKIENNELKLAYRKCDESRYEAKENNAKLQAVVESAIAWANTDQNDIDGCDKTNLELLDAVTDYEMSIAALEGEKWK